MTLPGQAARPWLHAHPAHQRAAPVDRQPHPRRPPAAARAALHRRAADRRRPRGPPARRGPGGRPMHHVFGGGDRRGGGRLEAGRRPVRPLRARPPRIRSSRRSVARVRRLLPRGHHRLRRRLSRPTTGARSWRRAADRRHRARRRRGDVRRLFARARRTAATFGRSRDCALRTGGDAAGAGDRGPRRLPRRLGAHRPPPLQLLGRHARGRRAVLARLSAPLQLLRPARLLDALAPPRPGEVRRRDRPAPPRARRASCSTSPTRTRPSTAQAWSASSRR